MRHGLLVITRSDLADPAPARVRALAEIRATSLGRVDSVTVSAKTGHGLDHLRRGLARLVHRIPAPDPSGAVRLWVDRAFTVRGAGLVVTGTLPRGRIDVGDELVTAPQGLRAKVRGIQTLEQDTPTVTAPARVALNLRGPAHGALPRGEALLTPGQFIQTTVCDVRLHGTDTGRLPRTLTLHIGAAARTVHLRLLGHGAARLSFTPALPLRLGDRALLRDPGRHAISAGVTVLDVRPPELRRRGAAATRARELAQLAGTPTEATELARRRLIRRPLLEAMGVAVTRDPVSGDWLADPAYWQELFHRLTTLVADFAEERPYADGLPLETARLQLQLPDRALVQALVRAPLEVRAGRIVHRAAGVPQALRDAVRQVRADLEQAPFRAPEAPRLVELGLGEREIRAATRAGLLLCLAPGIVLLPDAPAGALVQVGRLAQPFTVGAASRALDTTRRVSLPLLNHLDERGLTRRLPDHRREVIRSRSR